MQCLRRQFLSIATRQSLHESVPRLRAAFIPPVTTSPARRREAFSCFAARRQDAPGTDGDTPKPAPPKKKRKSKRSQTGKHSLRTVAVEAQRSRENKPIPREDANDVEGRGSIVAISVADQFDMDVIVSILRLNGFQIDPDGTGFETDQLIHARNLNDGDIFVFSSGTLVTWDLPTDVASGLATKTLRPAAVKYHKDKVEMEDLEYEVDSTRDHSTLKGDVIILGTKQDSQKAQGASEHVDTTYAKIAFSSGLARSTKLAVLETMLRKYFESTRDIPSELSQGTRLRFNRSFIMRKTGELLELRAQLNHYSELTDSLPDLFWDSRHELGLEGYYDQIGKVLDVGVRIRTLNQKMDYAQEIASILRQHLSEKHGIHLEWIIILLIAVEVVFGLRHIYKEWNTELEEKKET